MHKTTNSPPDNAQSLWSTTDTIRALDTAIMFGVMISVAALTYAIVFNLNNITRAVYRHYETIKQPWIRRMREEHYKDWSDRAERYSGFKIKRFDATPSEWYVVWYIINWPVRLLLPKPSQTSESHIMNQDLKTTINKSQPTAELDISPAVDNFSDNSWLKDHPPFPISEENGKITSSPRVFFLTLRPNLHSTSSNRGFITL
jgi:hypothetical protein